MNDAVAGENKLGISAVAFFGGVLIIALSFFVAAIVAAFTIEQFLPGTLTAIVNADGGPQNPAALISLLLSFVGVFIGLWIVKTFVLRRPWWVVTWTTGHKLFRGLAIYALIYAVIVITLDLVAIFYGDLLPNIPFEIWIKWAPLVVVLVAIQVSAEEVFFRGYLQRILFDWSASRLVWMGIPSVLFGLMHYQPSVMGANAWLLVLATTLFGFLAAELTFRTGSIGPAIGIHFVNNLNAFLIIQLDSGIGGLALYKTPYTPADVEAVRSSLIQGGALYLLLFVAVWSLGPRFIKR